MDEPTADPTEPIEPGLTDDELARSIRGALDDRIAPVTLDEVLVRAAALDQDREVDRDRDADGVAPVASPSDVDPDAAGSGGGPSPWARRRGPVLAAAAAVAVLVVGGVLLARDRSATLDVGGSSSAPTGGIYDGSTGVLHDRRVSALAGGPDGHVYVGYVTAADGATSGTAGAAAADAHEEAVELTNQAEAVGEQAELVERELADAAADAPANEVLRQEVAGLRERQQDLVSQAEAAEGQSSQGYAYGLLVADAGDGAVLVDHPLPERIRGESMVAIGSTLFFTTSTGGGPSTLWRSIDEGPPEVVEELAGRAELAGATDALWLRGTDVLQRRDPVTGAVVEAAPTGPAAAFAGYGAIATGEAGTYTVVGADVVVPVEAMRPGPALAVDTGNFAVRRLRVAGPSVFAVDGNEITRVDGSTGRSVGHESLDRQILGIDARAGRFWAAGTDDDPGTALVDVVVVDGTSGEQRVVQVAIVGAEPDVAALDDGDAVLCVSSIQTGAAEAPAPPLFGSECRRVTSPFATAEPPVTVSTTASSNTSRPSVGHQDEGVGEVPRTTSTIAGG